MRILMIAPEPFFEPRGTPIAVLNRLRALSELGHDVDIVTYHVGSDMEIPNVKLIRTLNIPFINYVPVGPSFIKIFLDVLLSVKVLTMLLFNKYDLLHTHEEASIIGALYSKVFKIPHLYDFHSSLPTALGNFGYHKHKNLIKLFELLERFAVRNSDGIITISPALTEYVRELDNNVPVETIENYSETIDTTSVTNEEVNNVRELYSIYEKQKIILYAGTFEHYQGLDLLLASADVALKKNSNLVFLLVGGNPNQIDRYKKQAQEMNLDDSFRFIGKRPYEEIPIFMKLADILVSPRITGDNTPLKIYSYLQSGTPIVATNIESHTQVLNTDIACLVDPKPESLAEEIINVCTDDKYAQSIACNAMDFCDKTYSIDSISKNLSKIINMSAKS